MFHNLGLLQSQVPSAANTYDNLPEAEWSRLSATHIVSAAHTLRLHEINDMLKIAEGEQNKRTSLAKKYQ